MANLDAPAGAPLLPSEELAAYRYGHVERTFSEFMLSAFAADGGAPGEGPFAPGVFETPLASNNIGRCQDCHMQDQIGYASAFTDQGPERPTGSVEHPKSGVSSHDLTGGNAWVPALLASTQPSSPNYDPENEALLTQGADVLTVSLKYDGGLDADALLAASARAIAMLQSAAAIEETAYDPATGELTLRVHNFTGHKLISGYPEGRRMWLNIQAWAGDTLLAEVNPYDAEVGTLVGLPPSDSPESPALTETQSHDTSLVWEAKTTSALTGEQTTFHFVLATGRYKDNRIPPKGFDIAAAAIRHAEPVWEGVSAPELFTAEEYAGGWDARQLTLPPGADRIEVRLFYQTTSREYVAFLANELSGAVPTLTSPTPSGRSLAYIADADPYFDALRAWGPTIWALWEHNKDLPGAAPVLMTEVIIE